MLNDLPFATKKTIDVNGKKMSYIDEGLEIGPHSFSSFHYAEQPRLYCCTITTPHTQEADGDA